jgi:hypothetical protein
MAKELLGVDTSGNVVYAIVLSPTNSVWNGSSLVAAGSATNTDRNNGAITQAEVGTTGMYAGDFPAGITAAGRYTYVSYRRAGGSPAVTDTSVSSGFLDWSGSAVAVPVVAGSTGEVTVAALSAAAKGEVNAEVLDVIATDTFGEVAGVPAATSTLKDKINWLFALARNKLTSTATTSTLRNDADSGNVATSSNGDAGGTFTRGEWT